MFKSLRRQKPVPVEVMFPECGTPAHLSVTTSNSGGFVHSCISAQGWLEQAGNLQQQKLIFP